MIICKHKYIYIYITYPNTTRVALGMGREKSKWRSAFASNVKQCILLICLGSVRTAPRTAMQSHILVKCRLEGQKILWAVQFP